MLTKQYYQKEFNRIYERFCFNLSLFGSDDRLRKSCYQEALTAVEKLKHKAIVNRDIDVSIARMALQSIQKIDRLQERVW